MGLQILKMLSCVLRQCGKSISKFLVTAVGVNFGNIMALVVGKLQQIRWLELTHKTIVNVNGELGLFASEKRKSAVSLFVCFCEENGGE